MNVYDIDALDKLLDEYDSELAQHQIQENSPPNNINNNINHNNINSNHFNDDNRNNDNNNNNYNNSSNNNSNNNNYNININNNVNNFTITENNNVNHITHNDNNNININNNNLHNINNNINNNNYNNNNYNIMNNENNEKTNFPFLSGRQGSDEIPTFIKNLKIEFKVNSPRSQSLEMDMEMDQSRDDELMIDTFANDNSFDTKRKEFANSISINQGKDIDALLFEISGENSVTADDQRMLALMRENEDLNGVDIDDLLNF